MENMTTMTTPIEKLKVCPNGCHSNGNLDCHCDEKLPPMTTPAEQVRQAQYDLDAQKKAIDDNLRKTVYPPLLSHTDERVEDILREFAQWAFNVIEHETERLWAKDFIRTTLTTYGAEREAKWREEGVKAERERIELLACKVDARKLGATGVVPTFPLYAGTGIHWSVHAGGMAEISRGRDRFCPIRGRTSFCQIKNKTQ